MNGFARLRIALAVMGVVFAGGSAAQLPSNGGNNLPSPRIRIGTCNQVVWEANLLKLYPRIAEGCQEVFWSEGQKWARFEADFIGRDGNGFVTLEFKDREHRTLERISLRPASDQRVTIDGRSSPLTELMHGERLNLYLPERTFAAAIPVDAPQDQLVDIVVEATPVAVAQVL